MPKKVVKKKKFAATSKKKPRVAKGGKVSAAKKGTVVGVVTHFFTAIKVAIIKCKKPFAVGTTVQIRGATTNSKQIITSMQYDHKAILVAPKNKEVGIKVAKRVREGDEVVIA